MSKFVARNMLFGCSLAAILVSAPAYAQDGAGASDDNQSYAGEIVVTANKREQNLSKVGLSVSAVSGEALANQRIANVADLAAVTPGLTFAPTPNATPVYTLRGVGFFESSLAAYPDVSLYVDQVPLPLPIMSTLTAFDLERVEVLKGPQGTLFGNNATGGAINFVAAKPTKDLSAGMDLSYGRFNTIEVAGFVSGPITDTLRARVAAKITNGDEWQKSYTRDAKLGKKDEMAVRMILDWDATEAFKVSLNLNAWRDRNDPQAPQFIASTPQNPTPSTWPVLNYPIAPNNARAADWTDNLQPFADNRFKQATLRGDYDFGGVTLTSLTGLSDLKFRNATEGGGTNLIDLDLGEDKGSIKSFTQELRLSNGADGAFRWVLGANYEHTKAYEQIGLYYKDTTSTYVNGIVVSSYLSDQKMKNYAAFGNIEYDVSDLITLKAGIRQTKAKRKYFATNGDRFQDYPIRPGIDVQANGAPGLSLTDFFNAVYGAIYGAGTVPTILPGGSIILDTRTNADGSPVDPSTYMTATTPRDKMSEDSTSWSLGADFKPNDNTLLYVNVSKGYKAGSFSTISGAIFDAYKGVKQESILDYEAGFKLQLMDRRLSINGAAFYYDYKNKQLRAKFVDPIFGALDQLVNVPKSTIKGAEIEINARPSDGLTLTASATYLDAKVKKYDGVVGSHADSNGLRVPDIASFKGVRLPFSPKLQYSVRADYDFPVNESLNAFIGVGVSGQSKSMGVLTTFGVNPDLFVIKSRALVNGNIGIHSADDHWRLTFWGKNIFNKYYWSNAIQAYDSVVRYSGRPAEYGVTVGFKM